MYTNLNKGLKNIHAFFLSMIFLLMVSSCSNEDDPFNGGDNYIVSFAISQNGATFESMLVGDTILLYVPKGLDLSGAKAEIQLSEHAKILPDPESITDWSEDLLFSITSYNNANRRQYQYMVRREGQALEGVFVLNTQDEVDAFGKKGITMINGSLVIGAVAGTDSIRSLLPLSGLEHISYNLTINKTYAGADIHGLHNLETVGSSITLTNEKTNEVEFSNLESIGKSLNLDTRNGLYAIKCPRLKSVGENVSLNAPYSVLDFSALQSVGGGLGVSSVGRAQPHKVTFQQLKSVGGELAISNVPTLVRIEFPELISAGSVLINSLKELNVISFPKLEIMEGRLAISLGNCLITDIPLPNLKEAGSLELSSNITSEFDLSSLQTVEESLMLKFPGSIDMDKLQSLETVRTFSLSGESEQLVMPPQLKAIEKLVLSGAFKVVNLKGLQIEELQITDRMYSGTKIIADDIFSGGINISGGQAGEQYAFPALEGFKEVSYLTFGWVHTENMVIEGIVKVNHDIIIPNNSIKKLHFSTLEEVGGSFTMNSIQNSTEEMFSFPKLKRVAENLHINILSLSTRKLNFPALEHVGGNFMIGTGYTAYGQNRSIEEVSAPSLESVGGILTISPIWDNPAYAHQNDLFSNLDGFAHLKTAQGINIYNQSVLTSYKGLENCLASFPAENWIASGNGYSPSYTDLSEERWEQ